MSLQGSLRAALKGYRSALKVSSSRAASRYLSREFISSTWGFRTTLDALNSIDDLFANELGETFRRVPIIKYVLAKLPQRCQPADVDSGVAPADLSCK